MMRYSHIEQVEKNIFYKLTEQLNIKIISDGLSQETFVLLEISGSGTL